jgi:hypothetical protein
MPYTLFLRPPYPLLPERIPSALLDQSLKWFPMDDPTNKPQQNLKNWLSGPSRNVAREEVEGVEDVLLQSTHLSINRGSLLSRVPQGSGGSIVGGDFSDDGETILAPTVLALALRGFLLMHAVGMTLEIGLEVLEDK